MSPPSIIGNFDGCDATSLLGWAFDRTRPDQPLEVKIRLSTGDAISARADLFRRDLLGQGIGDGRHGFKVKLPARAFREPIDVSVREAATRTPLPGSPRRVEAPTMDVFAGDIVDNCNLRCPFCMVDYANIRGLRPMTMETYQKLVAIMPLVADGMAWLSCLHEPTLHPRLGEMIAQTPAHLRRKLSFTTNLCKTLDDGTLETIAGSAMHHIRVSYDTRQPELFRALRKGGNHAKFSENLSRLTAMMRATSTPTPIAFVTVALRDNLREIPDLVRACAERYGPASHEVRFMYYLPHLAGWGKEHVLSLAEWAGLEAELKALPPPAAVELSGPRENAVRKFEIGEGADGYKAPAVSIGDDYSDAPPPIPDPEILGASRPNEPLKLRMRWDGLLLLDEKPLVNLNQIDDPETFFRTLRSNSPLDAADPWLPD